MATVTPERAVCITPTPDVASYPEAASQSFKKGEFVYLSSGKVTVCASDATSCIGLALEDATGTTDTSLLVATATPRNEFELSLYKSGDTSNAITAITQVGSKYGLYSASNIPYVDLAESTALLFHIQRLSPRDAVGDLNGRVIVKIVTDISQIGPGEKTA